MQGCEGGSRCAAPRLPPSQHYVLRERRRCSALQPRSGLGMVAPEHRGHDGYPPTAGGPAWQRSRPDLQQSCRTEEAAETVRLPYGEDLAPVCAAHPVEVIVVPNGMGETGTFRMTFWPA